MPFSPWYKPGEHDHEPLLYCRKCQDRKVGRWAGCGETFRLAYMHRTSGPRSRAKTYSLGTLDILPIQACCQTFREYMAGSTACPVRIDKAELASNALRLPSWGLVAPSDARQACHYHRLVVLDRAFPWAAGLTITRPNPDGKYAAGTVCAFLRTVSGANAYVGTRGTRRGQTLSRFQTRLASTRRRRWQCRQWYWNDSLLYSTQPYASRGRPVLLRGISLPQSSQPRAAFALPCLACKRGIGDLHLRYRVAGTNQSGMCCTCV